MTPWLTLDLLFTAIVFCAVTTRLRHTHSPDWITSCIARWLAWGFVHIGIALAMLAHLIDALALGHEPLWYGLLLKASLAMFFIVDWRRPCFKTIVRGVLP